MSPFTQLSPYPEGAEAADLHRLTQPVKLAQRYARGPHG